MPGGALLFPRSLESGALAGHRVLHVLDAIAEITFHGTSAVRALDSLLNAVNCPALDPAQTLAALTSASDDLSKASAAARAMERLAADSLSADGHREAMLFESGLVMAVSSDRSNSGRWTLGFLKH